MDVHDFVKKLGFSFLRAFLGAFVAGVPGILAVPNFTAGKAALVAVGIASLTAGFRAVQVFLPGVDSHA